MSCKYNLQRQSYFLIKIEAVIIGAPERGHISVKIPRHYAYETNQEVKYHVYWQCFLKNQIV